MQLPETGPTWQAMRLGRNHHWGNPATIDFIEDLSRTAVRAGWRGLYVGDIAQARGGPVGGHASHQTGLDVDIWFTPAAAARPQPRASASGCRRSACAPPTSGSVNGNWTPSHAYILEAAARDPRVNRIFVTAPVKLADVRRAPAAATRRWLRKIRPWWDHHDHFHVRLNCPAGARRLRRPRPAPGRRRLQGGGLVGDRRAAAARPERAEAAAASRRCGSPTCRRSAPRC